MSRYASAVLLTLAGAACSTGERPGPATGSPAAPLTFAGLWRSDGYGHLFRVTGDTLVRFEVTSATCVPTLTAVRQATPARPDTLRFVGAELNGDLGVQDGFDITAGATPDRRWLFVDGAITRIGLIRADSLPARCAVPPTDTPPMAYDVFWRTFREQYPFFALRRINWDSVDRVTRPQVTAATTPPQLFGVFRDLLAPLQDAHTFIHAVSLDTGYGGGRPGPEGEKGREQARIERLIAERFLQGPIRTFNNEQVQFGRLSDGVGYLRLRSFNSYSTAPGFAAQAAELERTLDTIFDPAAPLRGLIIDVRLNGGGSDNFGVMIAARLTDTPYLAYSKVIRNDSVNADARTAPEPVMVRPSTRPGFRGPVVLLTGPESVSAAETFAMALMGRRPVIRRIGEPTQGVFSDVLIRVLPNGWRFGLPNEIYLTEDGRAFDGPGIPPDRAVPVFATADLRAGRDPALTAAMEEIRLAATPR